MEAANITHSCSPLGTPYHSIFLRATSPQYMLLWPFAAVGQVHTPCFIEVDSKPCLSQLAICTTWSKVVVWWPAMIGSRCKLLAARSASWKEAAYISSFGLICGNTLSDLLWWQDGRKREPISGFNRTLSRVESTAKTPLWRSRSARPCLDESWRIWPDTCCRHVYGMLLHFFYAIVFIGNKHRMETEVGSSVLQSLAPVLIKHTCL